MKRIFLIGYMGAGKTTVGKVLSRQLGLSFIDLDHYIEGRYHKTVGQLFAEKGEDAFRDIERRMLRGQTVYLKVSVEELAKRLELCKSTRPILKGRSGDELKAFIAESLEKREPFYSKASIVFDAEEMMTDQDVYKISQELATRL